MRTIQINKTWPIIFVVAVVALAIYLWAFYNINASILTVGGEVSLIILLCIPAVTAWTAAASAVQEIKTSKRILPVRDYVLMTLRRLAPLLAIAAVVLIPIFVIYYLYFQLDANAIYGGLIACTDPSCSTLSASTTLSQALLILVIGIGAWGVNLVACVMAARLAIRGWDFIETVFATLVVVAFLEYAMYQLFIASDFIYIALIVIAAVLPYALAYAIAVIMPRAPGVIVAKRR